MSGRGTNGLLGALRGPRPVFIGMVLTILAGGLAGGLGAPMVSAIAHTYDVPLSVAQWSVTASLLVAAVCAPVVGRLGGAGRQRPVLIVTIGLAAFGTLLVALELGIGWLILGRALQGLSLAAQPLMMTVGRSLLPPEREAKGLSTLSVTVVVAAGLGFPAAALVGQWGGVQGAFWAGTVLLTASFLICVLVVPSASTADPPRLDLLGAFLLGGGTLAVLLATSQSRAWGYTSPAVLGLVVLGALLLVAAFVWLGRATDPLVDLTVARHPVVMACHLAGGFCGMGMYMLLTLCLVLGQADPLTQHGLGLSIAVAGLLMVPYSVCGVLANRVGLWLRGVAGPRSVTPTGCLLFAVSLLMLVWFHHEPWQLFLAMSLGGLGSGLCFTSIPSLMLTVVPASELASALSFNVVIRFVGFGVGSVVSLALLEVVDGHNITHSGMMLAAGVAAASCALAGVLAWWMLADTAPVRTTSGDDADAPSPQPAATAPGVSR